MLVILAGVGVSSALRNAGRFVWDWPSLARGEGLVPAKSFLPRAPDFAGYHIGCFSGGDYDPNKIIRSQVGFQLSDLLLVLNFKIYLTFNIYLQKGHFTSVPAFSYIFLFSSFKSYVHV